MQSFGFRVWDFGLRVPPVLPPLGSTLNFGYVRRMSYWRELRGNYGGVGGSRGTHADKAEGLLGQAANQVRFAAFGEVP